MNAVARGAAILAALTAVFADHEAYAAENREPKPESPVAVAAAKAAARRPRRRPAHPRAVSAVTPSSHEPPATPETTTLIPEPENIEDVPAAPAPPAPPALASPVVAGAPGDLGSPEKRFEIGGRVFTYVRAPISDIHAPLQQLSTTLWLDAHARVSKGTFAAVSVVGDLLTPSADGTMEARGRIREAYAGAHEGGVEVRIGQQIVAWGNADGLHAVDFVTAHDYAFYSVDGDSRQIGAPSVLISYKGEDGASPLELTAVWQPVAPVSTVLVPKNVLPAGVQLLDEDRPRYALADSEAALKIGYAPGGWDLAVIGFHGFNHLAEPYLSALQEGVARIGRAHHPINTIGLEASTTVDSWVLRFEGAYVMTENPDGRNRLVQPSYVDAIGGVERPLGERWRAGIQGVLRAYPNYLPLEAPYTKVTPDVAFYDRQIADVSARLFNYTHQTRPGATVAVRYTSEDEALELSVAGLAYFIGFDWVVQPMVGYRVFESMKLEVGAQIFGGHKNSLGFLSSQSGIFAQATYTF